MQLIAEKEVGTLGRIVIPEDIRLTHSMGVGSRIRMYVYAPGKLLIESIDHDQKDGWQTCPICRVRLANVALANDHLVCRRCAEHCANAIHAQPVTA